MVEISVPQSSLGAMQEVDMCNTVECRTQSTLLHLYTKQNQFQLKTEHLELFFDVFPLICI